ncbi:MAG: hypothetical protein V1853_00130 [bacterium]
MLLRNAPILLTVFVSIVCLGILLFVCSLEAFGLTYYARLQQQEKVWLSISHHEPITDQPVLKFVYGGYFLKLFGDKTCLLNTQDWKLVSIQPGKHKSDNAPGFFRTLRVWILDRDQGVVGWLDVTEALALIATHSTFQEYKNYVQRLEYNQEHAGYSFEAIAASRSSKLAKRLANAALGLFVGGTQERWKEGAKEMLATLKSRIDEEVEKETDAPAS